MFPPASRGASKSFIDLCACRSNCQWVALLIRVGVVLFLGIQDTVSAARFNRDANVRPPLLQVPFVSFPRWSPVVWRSDGETMYPNGPGLQLQNPSQQSKSHQITNPSHQKVTSPWALACSFFGNPRRRRTRTRPRTTPNGGAAWESSGESGRTRVPRAVVLVPSFKEKKDQKIKVKNMNINESC